MPPLTPHHTPDPDALAPPAALVATMPTEDGPPPLGAVPSKASRAHTASSPPQRAPSRFTGKARHLVTGSVALGLLGTGGAAWAVDPSALEPSSPLMLAPAVTLAAQAVMALIGYLRDYGAERLEVERRRAEEAAELRRAAERRAAELDATIERMEKERDDAREAALQEALAEVRRLRG